jgi:uncharacterized tellurite resistance protein B-like protein
MEAVRPAGAAPWLIAIAAVIAALIFLYAIQPPVRRRLARGWRVRRMRSVVRRLRARRLALAADQARVEAEDIEHQAQELLARSWLREIDEAPGIGPGLIAEIRKRALPPPPLLRASHLLSVRGIKEARAQAILRHLAAAEIRIRSELSSAFSEGRLSLSAQAEANRARLHAEQRLSGERLGVAERELGAAVRARGAIPRLGFGAFLVRLLGGRFWTRSEDLPAPAAGALARAQASPPRDVSRAASPLEIPPEAGREAASSRPGSLEVPPRRTPPLLQALIDGRGSKDVAVLPVREIAAALGVAEKSLASPRTSEILARLIEDAGYGIEPDVRAPGKGGKVGKAYRADERAALYVATPGPMERTRYLAAEGLLRFGVAVALSDGSANAPEVERIALELEGAFEVSAAERRRLDALRALLLETGSGLEEIERAFTARLEPAKRLQLARFLVAVAGVDGAILAAEAEFLRKVFRRLRVPVAELDRMLEAGGPPAGAAAAPGPIELDREAIDRILAQSRDVARILAEAMAEEPDPEVPPARPPAAEEAPPRIEPPGGVPARYHGFYHELVIRERWPLEEAEELARRHGHMLAGAIEAVNEWAFEALGGALLVEVEDELIVEVGLLKGAQE